MRTIRIRVEIESSDGMAYIDGVIDRTIIESHNAMHPHGTGFLAGMVYPFVDAVADKWVEETRKVKP